MSKAGLPLEELWKLLKKIPKGKVSTYKAISEKLRVPNPRNVGWMLKQNPHAPIVPCHRVIQSSGHIGGYNGKSTGTQVRKKLNLLSKEGVSFNSSGKIVDSSQILKRL